MAEPQTPLEVAKENLPETLPVLPLYDAVLFPKMVIPLVVLQGESIKLVDEAMTKDRIVGLLVSKKSADQKPEPESNEESGGKVPRRSRDDFGGQSARPRRLRSQSRGGRVESALESTEPSRTPFAVE